jgi:signal peptidase II
MGSSAAWSRAIATLGLVVALDQTTKQVAVAALERGESRNVFFGLELTNVRNKGVAFGFLSGGGTPIVVLTALALALLVGYFLLHLTMPGLWLPVGMLLGGAFGNLADRAREGAVIDFIDPAGWPAFNLADAAIVLGVPVLLYVIEGARPRRAPP